MTTESSVSVRGSAGLLYRLAAKVEDWPEILPHYRRVRILEEEGDTRIVRMECVREFGLFRWPCRWTARQTILPTDGRIHFEHLAGPASGMLVEWIVEQVGHDTTATIRHEMRRSFYADRMVGPLFVHPIATRTLQTLKSIIERETGL